MHRAQNPFDSQEGYDHFPRFSPSIFSTRKTPEREGHFQWSIDNIAAIKPVEIDAHNHDPDSDLSPETEAQIQSQVEKFFSQKTILPSPWTAERQPRKHVTFSPHPPQTTYFCNDNFMESQAKSRDACCQTTLTFPTGFDVESMVGPQYLYVDEDWANSSLRRKLFGRPRHREGSSMEKGQDREVRQDWEDPDPAAPTSCINMSVDSLGTAAGPPRQEEPALFSPEVDVHRGDPLSFDQVEHALQSSFEAKEDILMASLPSPLTPYTRTPQAPRMTEKDIPPLPCLLEVSDQCPSPPTSSPPGTPSLSPINNTAMVQAAAATGGAQLMNVCGSGSKTTSTPAKVAHAQRTAADPGIQSTPIVLAPIVDGEELHECIGNGALEGAGHDSTSTSSGSGSRSNSPLPKPLGLNDLESETLDFTSDHVTRGASETGLLHDQQDSVMEVSLYRSETREIERDLTSAFSSCPPVMTTFSHSIHADSGVVSSGYLGESRHTHSKGFTSRASELDSAAGVALNQERRQDLEALSQSSKCYNISRAPNDSGVGVNMKTGMCYPNGTSEQKVLRGTGLDLSPRHTMGSTQFASLAQPSSHTQSTKHYPVAPMRSYISPQKSPLGRSGVKAPHLTASHPSQPPHFIGMQSETPKSRSSLRGSFTRYHRSLGSGGHERSGGGSGSSAAPSSAMMKDMIERKERLKAKLQHEPISSLEGCALSPSPFHGQHRQPLGVHSCPTPLRPRPVLVDKPVSNDVRKPVFCVQGKENEGAYWRPSLQVNQVAHAGYEDWKRSVEHWEEAIRINTPHAKLANPC